MASEAGVFAQAFIHVSRECTDQEGLDTSYTNFKRLRIPTDAGRAFWSLFEMIREAEFRGQSAMGFSTIAGYPVTPAEEIQDNPLVRTCQAEWKYGGQSSLVSLGGVPTFSVTQNAWSEARTRLSAGEQIPAHLSFALDAAYFSKFDPLRAVIMACAAWETALRYYLSDIASQRDPSYARAAERNGIPVLYRFAVLARGGHVFCDQTHPAIADFIKRERECLEQMPRLRNKLLHEGNRALPEGAAIDTALTVLNAIDGLAPIEVAADKLFDLNWEGGPLPISTEQRSATRNQIASMLLKSKLPQATYGRLH